MTTKKPTKRQGQIYRMILRHCQKHGAGPTVREIGEKFSISSPNGVVCHLLALEKKGLIYRGNDNNARTLRPVCSYVVESVEG